MELSDARGARLLCCFIICLAGAATALPVGLQDQTQLLPCNSTSGPVCCSGNAVFPSECDAYQAGVTILYHGKCIQKLGCHINCLRPDPVCGKDSVTYWCGAPSAACARTEVAYVGICSSDSFTGSSWRLKAWDSLLLVHLVWLVLVGLMVVGGLV